MSGIDAAVLAALLAGVALIIGAVGTALATVLVAVAGLRKEVKTANGLSVGKLLDHQEGRRILRDILELDRTEHEQGYVDRLKEDERDQIINPPV